ncbi:MAG: hypothetical protein V4534_07175 [Myxococcota bacterium]
MMVKLIAFALLIALSASAQSLGYYPTLDTATSTRFSPLVLRLDQDSRVHVNANFMSTPSGEIDSGMVFKLWDGFDAGFGVHGGLLGGEKASGILGFDFLFRYIRPIHEQMFVGVQTQIGYVYSGIGYLPRSVNYGSAFPITLGVVFGGVVRESTQVYFYPAVDLGKTANAGDALWKSGIGLQFAIGTAIAATDSTFWVLEVQPALTNFTGSESVFQTFRVGLTLGVLFDL